MLFSFFRISLMRFTHLYASNLLNRKTFSGAVSILKKVPIMQCVYARGEGGFLLCLWVFISSNAVRKIWGWSEKWMLLRAPWLLDVQERTFSSRSHSDISILFQSYGRCTVEKKSPGWKTVWNQRPTTNHYHTPQFYPLPEAFGSWYTIDGVCSVEKRFWACTIGSLLRTQT